LVRMPSHRLDLDDGLLHTAPAEVEQPEAERGQQPVEPEAELGRATLSLLPVLPAACLVPAQSTHTGEDAEPQRRGPGRGELLRKRDRLTRVGVVLVEAARVKPLPGRA